MDIWEFNMLGGSIRKGYAASVRRQSRQRLRGEFCLRRGFACGKTLVRRKSAAAQKGRWAVFKKSVEDLKISRLSAGTWFYLSFNSLTRTARLKSCRSRCFCPPRPCLNRAASIVLPNKICYVLFINCLTVRGILIGKRLHSPVHRGCIPAHVT